MTRSPRTLVLSAFLALGLTGSRVDAHPLFRLHVRPAAYRLAPPRLPSLLPAAASAVRKAVALAPLGASLVPPGLAPTGGAVPQAVLNVLRHR